MGANFSNRLDLMVFGDPRPGLALVGRLDNLGKGASGNAVQCLKPDAGAGRDHQPLGRESQRRGLSPGIVDQCAAELPIVTWRRRFRVRDQVLKLIQWTVYSLAPAIEQKGVDQGGRHVAVAQQLLNGPDVLSRFQQMGGERVTQGVAVDPL